MKMKEHMLLVHWKIEAENKGRRKQIYLTKL